MRKLIATAVLALSISTAAHAQYENTKIKVGQLAPELNLTTPDDKPIKLSEVYEKRVVLLDFWASWCGPCRRANPRLVEMYKKYNGQKIKGAKKGFEVVSISLDKDKDPWVKAIAKDSLYWPYHMSDLKGWDSKAASEYGTSFIPQAFLVGPDGAVIAKYNFAEQAAEDLEKMLKDGYTSPMKKEGKKSQKEAKN
ncbi:MAG TPA: TlpA disulfide reductase family protein [Flavipsychrobacter sp.]